MLDPPDKRLIIYLFAIIVITAAMSFLIGYFLGFLIMKEPEPKTSSMYIQGNSIKAPMIPYIPRIDVLGNKTSDIIFCESSNNPNAYNPKSGACGLLQVIPSSERFCEKGLNRELDMRNPDDNIACGKYLFEHGGLAHWESSENCWGNLDN